MNYQDYLDLLLPKFEDSLRQTLLDALGEEYPDLNRMFVYHMGWEGPGAGPKASGKRLRPMLLLLSSIACGNKWEDFLPFAAAVELVHNFSLIHDDIEDGSPLRRGRETVWKLWGIPQAINTGDLMFTIAHKTIHGCSSLFGEHITLEASRLLLHTCIRLTQGQYLDMEYERRMDVSSDGYLKMIAGKTGALLSCCTELGAITASSATRKAMEHFGLSLGLAFQIQDDLLGLWGDSAVTGKSAESDLVSGKKTYPILYALQHNPAVKDRWMKGAISPKEAKEISAQLMSDGTYAFTKEIVKHYTADAIDQIKSTGLNNDAISALIEITGSLTARNS